METKYNFYRKDGTTTTTTDGSIRDNAIRMSPIGVISGEEVDQCIFDGVRMKRKPKGEV